MLYTDLETLKSHLAIECADEDESLKALIETATELIDTDLGENLETRTKTRRIDGGGNIRIIMENRINTVLYVKDFRTGFLYTVDFIDGYMIYLTTELERGMKNIEVSYTMGYDSVPKDFERYFLEYCKELYRRDQITSDTDVVKTKKLGDLSVTFFSPSELVKSGSSDLDSPDMEKIIAKYKHFSIHTT